MMLYSVGRTLAVRRSNPPICKGRDIQMHLQSSGLLALARGKMVGILSILVA